MGAVLIVMMTGTCGSLLAATTFPGQVGTATVVKGEVRATTPPDTVAHTLRKGDPVFMGDKIETGADGQLEVKLLDKTVFSLGASGGITMDEFIYDPKTDDGKVRASILKGAFRIVTGKVAHKRSENMSVGLPSGTLGFRGTIVAGIVDGTRSTIVLIGPVGVGRVYVTNLVNGQLITVDIDEAGHGTIIDGPNSVPVDVFQVSEEELARIAASLGLSVPDLNGEGYTPPDMPDPDALDNEVQTEETSKDISAVSN